MPVTHRDASARHDGRASSCVGGQLACPRAEASSAPTSRLRDLRSLLGLLLVVLARLPAAAQTVLLEDGQFDQWTTVPQLAGHQVSGRVDAAAGAPPPSYRIEHVHGEVTFGGAVVSRAVHTGATFELSSFVVADRLELRVDACVGVLQGAAGVVPVTLSLLPLLLQGETVFRPQQIVNQDESAACPTNSPALGRLRLAVPLGDFRSPGGQPPNLSPGAPRARLALIVQSTWGLQGTTLVRLDNLSLRHLPAAGLPVTLDLTDRDQAWADEVGETIGYEITVENTGAPRNGLVVEVRVPNNTCFTREGSTVGWECGAEMSRACSVDGDGLCSYDLGPLGTGASAEVSFTVSLQTGIPAQWEFLAEARVLSQSGDELAAEDEVTPPVTLTGPGCLCLFAPGVCAGE